MLYFELGRALASEARHEEAVAALGQALREPGATPRSADIGVVLAAARAGAGDSDGALEAALFTLLEITPDDAERALRDVEARMADARVERHRELLLDRKWRRLVAEPPLSDGVRAAAGGLIGRALLAIGEPGGAEPLLAAAAELAATNAELHRDHGRALDRIGRHLDAVAEFDAAHRCAEERGDSALADLIAVERACSLLAADDLDRALTSLPDPLPGDDTWRVQALAVRAVVLLARGSFEAAHEAAHEAARLAPDARTAQIEAYTLLALHRAEHAIAVIDRALKRDPTHARLQLTRWVAQVEGQAGLDFTQDIHRPVRRVSPDVVRECLADPAWRARDEDGRAHYARAELLHLLGDFAAAAHSCRRAIDLGLGVGLPNEPLAPVYGLLANALEHNGGDDTETASAHFEAGVAYYFRSQWAKAAEHLHATVERRPDDASAPWYLASAVNAQAYAVSEEGAGEETDGTVAGLLDEAESIWDRAAASLPGSRAGPTAFAPRSAMTAACSSRAAGTACSARRSCTWSEVS